MTVTAASPEHRTPAHEIDDQIELVSPDSLTAEVVGHWTYLLAEGAAFVMQGMHPVIAEVTGRYSAAYTDPAGRAIRSVDSVLRWVYGGTEAIAEGNRVRALHEPLTMHSEHTGKHISALNPDAYQWVVATAYITSVRSGPLVKGRDFTPAEKDEILLDNRRMARLLHVPMTGYPETHQEFDTYFEDMVGRLEATPQIMQIMGWFTSGDVPLPDSVPVLARPVLRRLLRPALRLSYLSIVALLDPRLREKLGVAWSEAEQSRLERIYARVRLAYRILPERLTYFPLAYHARKHHQCLQQMTQRDEKSWAYRVRPRQV